MFAVCGAIIAGMFIALLDASKNDIELYRAYHPGSGT